jgi:hypothetical protein
MSIGTEIIKDAFKEIGAHSVVMEAPAESLIDGMNKLNSMLQLWRSKNIMLEVIPLQVPGDELGEPSDSRNAIVFNLAIECAPLFDNGKVVVSAQLKANANRSFNDIKDLYQTVSISKKVVSSTLPKGQGHKNRHFSNTFFDDNDTIGN